jgi:hypothetical protein
MNKAFKKIIKYYLIIGVIWGGVIRFPNGIELSEYSGKRAYENRITEVTNSYISESGDLVLCLKGQLAYSTMFPIAIKDFSLSIPIEKIKQEEAYKSKSIKIRSKDSTTISIFDSVIGQKCSTNKELNQVQVKHADYTPKQAYDFYSVRDLKGLKPLDGKEYMVLLVPYVNTYPEPHFMDMKKLYIILKTPDIVGRNYYEIYLEDIWIDRDIGFGEYFSAFLKDALFFPRWIVMMFSW